MSALLSHGAADLVCNMLHDQSDGLIIPYCTACNRCPEQVGDIVWCKKCGNQNNLVLRRVTFSLLRLENSIKMCGYKLNYYENVQDASVVDERYSDQSDGQLDEESSSSDEDYSKEMLRYLRRQRGQKVNVKKDIKQEKFDQEHEYYRRRQIGLEDLPAHYVTVNKTSLIK